MFGRTAEDKGVTRVFEFGCGKPTAGLAEAIDQMRKRNWLWNQFVEIERWFRAEESKLVDTPGMSDIRELRAELGTVRGEMRKHKQAAAYAGLQMREQYAKLREIAAKLEALVEGESETEATDQPRIRRSKREWLVWQEPETARGLKAQAKALAEQMKDIWAAERVNRKAAFESTTEARAKLEKERNERVKKAMLESGCWWGNSDDVRASYEVARKSIRKRMGRDGRPAELRFHRFDGSGKVAIRYQQGLALPGAFGDDGRLRIAPIDQEKAWLSTARSERRHACKTDISIRVASKDRQPVWLQLPCWIDGRPERHLPPDAEIRSAAVLRNKVGRDYHYKLTLCVRLPDDPKPLLLDDPTQPPAGRRSVGIDIGWRKRGEDLRVAYWADDSGHSEFILPARVKAAIQKCDNLRSIRDEHFNTIIERLSEFRQEAQLPESLKEQTQAIQHWERKGRLVCLIRAWKEQRFAGDEEIMEHLAAWLVKENHLYDWESNQRDQALLNRRELYRIFASSLRKYDRVIIEDFDLRAFAQQPHVETGEEMLEGNARTLAACSVLRGCIENFCKRERIEIVKAPAELTTKRCHACGSIEQWDQRAKLEHVCGACGLKWDQDYNAAVNLLKYDDWGGLAAEKRSAGTAGSVDAISRSAAAD